MKKWTKPEIEYLRVHYPTADKKELAETMGVTVSQLRFAVQRYGIRRAVGFGRKKLYTADDDALIALHYPKGDLDTLCERLNVSRLALYSRARLIGVSRDAEMVLEKNRELGKILAAKDLGKRFNKGHVPKNKGLKQVDYCSPETIERIRATQFKKGHKPVNYKPIGYERVSTDGYVEVKVRNADDHKRNFVLKHRLIWEMHHGPVPEGMMVKFRDGNRKNLKLENLYLSSMAENARVNIEEWHSLPPDVKENVKLLKKLKQALK